MWNVLQWLLKTLIFQHRFLLYIGGFSRRFDYDNRVPFKYYKTDIDSFTFLYCLLLLGVVLDDFNEWLILFWMIWTSDSYCFGWFERVTRIVLDDLNEWLVLFWVSWTSEFYCCGWIIFVYFLFFHDHVYYIFKVLHFTDMF
jgi:hypothetical protein